MSLTATQAIVSMPRARNASACWMKPGMCLRWQVGVNAPGTAKSTTRLPRKTSAMPRFCGPFSPMVTKVASGSRSPTLIDMSFLSKNSADDHRPYHAAFARNHRQRQRLADQRIRLFEPEHRQSKESGIESLRRREIEIGIALDENVDRRPAYPLEPYHQLVALPLARRLERRLPDFEPASRCGRNLGQPVEHELPIGRGGSIDGERRRQLCLGRNADRLADRKIQCQLERYRSRRIAGDDLDREDHLILITDRLAAFVMQPRRRRKQDLCLLQIGGCRPVERRRHAGLAGDPPVGLP